jgi:hypothetical protein
MASAKPRTKGKASGKSTKKSSSTAKTSTKKKSSSSSRGRRGTGRELIDTGTDKRFVRRRDDGTFKESDDVGRSLAADRRRKAKTVSKSGQGDRGDRKR